MENVCGDVLAALMSAAVEMNAVGPVLSGGGMATLNEPVAAADALPAPSVTAPDFTAIEYAPSSAESHAPPGPATVYVTTADVPSADPVAPTLVTASGLPLLSVTTTLS